MHLSCWLTWTDKETYIEEDKVYSEKMEPQNNIEIEIESKF